MKLKPGIFLNSTNALNSTVFEDVQVYIAEQNIEGALGFVINKTFARKLNELEEFKDTADITIYNGGPVDNEHLFFIHRRPDLIDEGKIIDSWCYFGGNFKQAIAAINSNAINTADIKIFIGYCGWDAGDLEAEIEEGSWTISDVADPFMK
jgi:putative transcriptional regulator